MKIDAVLEIPGIVYQLADRLDPLPDKVCIDGRQRLWIGGSIVGGLAGILDVQYDVLHHWGQGEPVDRIPKCTRVAVILELPTDHHETSIV